MPVVIRHDAAMIVIDIDSFGKSGGTEETDE
jgi:hypothetical protein